MYTIKLGPKVRITMILLKVQRVFFILSIFSVSSYSIAQTYKHPIFDSLKIIPANPSPNDNVRIICYTNLSTSPAYLDSSKVSNQNNQIDLDLYYLIGNFMANSIRVDTIDLGFLNSGNYSLGAYAYSYLTEHPNFNSDTAYINFKVARDNVGIQEEINFQNLKLYPNPTSNLLSFTLKDNSKAINLEILDVTGKIRKAAQFSNQNSGEFKNSIDIYELKNGIYFCRFSNGKNEVVKKFIKE